MVSRTETFDVTIHNETLDAFQCQVACALKLYTEPRRHFFFNRIGQAPGVTFKVEKCILHQLGIEVKPPSPFTELAAILKQHQIPKYQDLYLEVENERKFWSQVGNRAYEIWQCGTGPLQQR